MYHKIIRVCRSEKNSVRFALSYMKLQRACCRARIIITAVCRLLCAVYFLIRSSCLVTENLQMPRRGVLLFCTVLVVTLLLLIFTYCILYYIVRSYNFLHIYL